MVSKSSILKHGFTDSIIEILTKYYGEYALDIFESSPLLGYLNIKTKAANRGSKARYWIQEDLLQVSVRHKDGVDCLYNIAKAIIDIIDAYVATKLAAFESFLKTCREIAELGKKDPQQATSFVLQQLQLNVDARIFEIVSYAVLKAKYGRETVWIGETQDSVTEEVLVLYKTGRTNANDGGIDFVMKPLGRFFQVTETIDMKKYFLDIDKIQRFPITFVVKSTDSELQIRAAIRLQAIAQYKIETVVESYMKAVEEIINVPDLVKAFDEVVKTGQLQSVMDEIVAQSKVEFNYSEELEDPSDLEEIL